MRTSNPNRTFQQHIRDLPIESQWPIENFKAHNIHAVLASMQEGSALAVCDGSFKKGSGAAAWVLEAAEGQGRISGTNHVPGNDTVQSS
jgi:hypothetical protein